MELLKKHIFIVAMLVTIGLVATNVTSSVNFTPTVNNNEEVVSVLVYLKNQIDLVAINNEMDREHASLQERHETVVVSLQNIASVSQPQLVEYLTELQKQELVKDFQCFWISNIIRVDTYQIVVDQIKGRDDVLRVYPNYEIELIEPTYKSFENEPGNMDDVEPGVIAVRAPEVWEKGITGEGILVATIDTGVDGSHPALASRWAGVADPRYEGHPEWAWFDPYLGQNDFPYDDIGHGTHTMGTVCGGAPGDQIGVAPGAHWISAGAIDRGDNSVADAIESFQWLIDPDGNPETNWDVPAVCSNSWGVMSSHGYPPCDETFWYFLDACEAAGIVIIFSAGNEGYEGLRRPADRATDDYNCFAVGAIDAYDPNWPVYGMSSRGPTYCTPSGDMAIKPEIVAPGVDVRSSVPGGGYYYATGTSMASPHINGVVALMREAKPNIGVEDIKETLFQTAYDLGDTGEDNDYGWGMVDAYKAIFEFSLPPKAPDIDGPTGGKVGTPIVYTFNSVDPENDDVFYYINWDDGTVENWDGPHSSGANINISHTYTKQDTYNIKAKAKDTFGGESDWGSFTVTIPRDKSTNNMLLLRILASYPLLQKLIQNLDL